MPRLVPQEAHAIVERQPPVCAPRVLQVELRDDALALDLGKRIDFGVALEGTEQRVRDRLVRVERIVRVDVEVELSGPRTGAHTAAAFGIAGLLQVEARLHRVPAANPREVRAKRRQPRLALIDQTVVEREVRRVVPAEAHLRDDVPRVQVRIELPDGEADGVAIDPVPVGVGQGIELLGLLTGADVGVEDEVRSDDLRVVHADAAVRVQIVRVEEPPLCGPGCYLTASLIRIPVLEGEVKAVRVGGSPIHAHDVVQCLASGCLVSVSLYATPDRAAKSVSCEGQ